MSDPDRVSRRDLFRARFSRAPREPEPDLDLVAPRRGGGRPWAPLPEAIAETLVELAGVAAWESLLEVGAGDGAVARAAVARNAFAVVAGAEPRAVAHGRRQAVLEAHDALPTELPFVPGEFDRAIAPFGAGRDTLLELARVVRPGGTILVTGWAPEGVVARAARAAEPPAPDWGDGEGVRAALAPFCGDLVSLAREERVAVGDALALAIAAGAPREDAEALLVEAGNGPRIAVSYVVTTGRRLAP